MRKPKPTPAAVKAHAAEVSYNRKFAGYKRTLKALCNSMGLQAMEYRKQFIQYNPTTRMEGSAKNFSHAEVLRAWSEAIEDYKTELSELKIKK